MQLLLIKINAIDANPEYALLGSKQKEDRFTPSNWKKVRSLTRGRRVLLAIPNDDVVLTSIKVPSKNKKQLLQAVPFALEDNLADDIENLHFAIHQENSEDETQVAVINRKQLDDFISLLKKNGIVSHFILPQILIQPIQKDAWSILQSSNVEITPEEKTGEEGDEGEKNNTDEKTLINVRLNDYYGFTCNKSLLPIFVEQQETDKLKEILSNVPVEELPETLQDFPYTFLDPTKVLYKSAKVALALNLQTGFISDKKESQVNWKVWRATAVIASLLITTWIGIFGWQNTVLQKQKNQLDKSIKNIFTTTFPTSRLVDPPQQMTSKLALLKKNTGAVVNSPLPLISDISPLLKEYKDLTLSEIRFKENELVLVVRSPNLTRLEKFKQDASEKSGLHVEIKTSTTTADKVEATLLISPLKLSSNKAKLDQENA